FYIFTHDTWAIAPSVYKWVRDTRIGEVTKMKQGFFRIFFQSQLYAVIGLFILLALIFGLYLLNKNFKDYKKDKNFIKLSLFVVFIFTSVIISLSRSFWAGGITAGIVFVGLFLLFFKERLLFIKYIIISVAVLMAGGYLVIFILAKFPLPYQKGDGAMMSFISSRAKLDIKESATASRWSMLPPLVGKILERSIIGHGFGQEVTYKSSDPRVVASTAGQTGLYTTYAFEWGYLDMWLKFGLFGVGVLIWFLFVLFWDGVKISREFILGLNNKKDGHGDLNDGHGELNDCHGELVEPLLILGLLLGFVALGASHGFSPYLNHPLGIGYLIIFSLMLGKYNSKLTI
ncbi:MAG: O-antigen ligase family protein, partial [Candidatus Thermoplasmatota archaeon]|nr:O-antigen ligase family protein [Candidatus Thermoplasmatota archaeon]